MLPTRQGSFRLFRLAGIDVYLHWYWFLWAAYRITSSKNEYSSHLWNGIEYLGLFVIVLMHEYGHALAARSVGGDSKLIVLWPFGGVAYVKVPERPGANLWSIAAGPLVNVALIPVFYILYKAVTVSGSSKDVILLCSWLQFINIGMLIFNLLPVYPLDGGQILRSLLWFVFGRSKSLLITSLVGFVGFGVLALVVVFLQAWVALIILGFVMLPQCIGAFKLAQQMKQLESAPRYADFACPGCHAAPVAGNFWMCGHCRTAFDTFCTRATCPNCQATYDTTTCPECGQSFPFGHWMIQPPPPPTPS